VPDQTQVFVIVALITFALPIAFLVAVAYAAGRRRRGIEIGGRLSGFLTILGGTCFGVFLLTGADDLLIAGPILGGALLMALLLWRRRRRIQAGQVILGTALPWTVLYTTYVLASLGDPTGYPIGEVLPLFSLGVAGLAVGAALIARGDPEAPAATAAAPAGDPGSRSFGTIAEAIREPGRVGPFGTSELAALVGIVVGWAVIPLFVPIGIPSLARFAIAVVVGAVLGTEAYIRAMPERSRRAFEAFSWLGEFELARARDVAPGTVPTDAAAAEEWLATHPETDANRWLVSEVLVLAGRYDEARAVAARLPDSTPAERFARVEAFDSIDWRAGGDGDLAGLRAAADEVLPADGDERLRAEVSIATAEVRRRMADGRATPGDAIEPLLVVRKKLGKRADGQVGRALRRRLLLTFTIVGTVLGGVFWLLDPLQGRLG
jgi:hypothetical protein